MANYLSDSEQLLFWCWGWNLTPYGHCESPAERELKNGKYLIFIHKTYWETFVLGQNSPPPPPFPLSEGKGWVKKNLLFQNLRCYLHGNRLTQGAETFRGWCTHEYTKLWKFQPPRTNRSHTRGTSNFEKGGFFYSPLIIDLVRS